MPHPAIRRALAHYLVNAETPMVKFDMTANGISARITLDNTHTCFDDQDNALEGYGPDLGLALRALNNACERAFPDQYPIVRGPYTIVYHFDRKTEEHIACINGEAQHKENGPWVMFTVDVMADRNESRIKSRAEARVIELMAK